MRKLLICIATFLAAICLTGLAACGEATATQASASSVRVTFVDVGKGDCALVQAGDSSVLIDTGYQNTAADVLACLKAQGVNRLDAMIITHYDRDHIGGIRAIGEGVATSVIYLPEYEGADKNYRSCIEAIKELGVPSQRVTKELVLSLGAARLTIFPSGVAYVSDAGNGEGNDNDASIVVALVNDRDSYLFAGDLEKDGIRAYLEAKHEEYDVLKMPHHGQRSSNTDDFIEDVHPQIAVITDAKKDPADKKILKLLAEANVETYRTSVNGTIAIESDGTGAYAVLPSNG